MVGKNEPPLLYFHFEWQGIPLCYNHLLESPPSSTLPLSSLFDKIHHLSWFPGCCTMFPLMKLATSWNTQRLFSGNADMCKVDLVTVKSLQLSTKWLHWTYLVACIAQHSLNISSSSLTVYTCSPAYILLSLVVDDKTHPTRHTKGTQCIWNSSLISAHFDFEKPSLIYVYR